MDALGYQTIKRLSLAGGLWFCAPVEEDKVGVRFEGYLVPPFLLPEAYTITVNGVESLLTFDSTYSTLRFKDIFDRFDCRDNKIRQLTFSFYVGSPSVFPKHDTIVIAPKGLQSESLLPFYFAKSIDLPAPEIAGMIRTTKIRDIDTFNYTGINDFNRIRSIVERYSSTTSSNLSILDWGCGCGRVSRFFENAFGACSVYGVDIDPVNIKWNQQHLDKNRYKLISFEPALPFNDNHFDVIYGISVMTHLGSENQASWLKELHRALKPGGTLILTYHGLAMFFAHVNDGTILDKFLGDGFWDQGRNLDLDEGYPEMKKLELYRNSFNTLDNIANQCSDLFTFLKFLPGAHLAQHDYVVLKKIR